MAPWDEWEQLKSEAAGREPTSMSLNQAPAGPGGGFSEDLRTDKKAWAEAGSGVIGLKEGIASSLTKLDSGQAGLGDTGGIASAAAQKELYASWKKYVGDVSGRCDALGGLLRGAGHDLAKTDESVKRELDAITARYGDTEPVGGGAKAE